MTEQWRDVPGWEGFYQVSDSGRVRSVPREFMRMTRWGTRSLVRRKGRVLSPSVMPRGNRQVKLQRDGVPTSVSVHRLVLLAFVGPCPEGMEACHFDDDPSNNALANLRWDTKSANAFDRVRNGTDAHSRNTQCPQGHPYSPENTYYPSSGGRICRTCNRAYCAARRAKNKEKAA